MAKRKRTNNNLQNTTLKTKDRLEQHKLHINQEVNFVSIDCIFTHLNTLVSVWSWLRDRHKYVVVLPVVKTNVTSIH
jgi:hypothetical protein